MKKSIWQNKILTYIIVALQLISSVAFLYLVYRYLPTTYLIVAIVVLALILIGLALMSNSKKGTKKQPIAKILSLLISICLFIASFYIYRTNAAIDSMTSVDYEIDTISVIVMDESSIETINDLEGVNLGVNPNVQADNIDNALVQLQEVVAYELVEIESFEELANDLYDGSVDAIMISEASRSVMEVFQEGFSEETRVITQFEYKENIEGSVIDITDEEGESTSVTLLEAVDVTTETFNVFISGIDTYGSIGTRSRSDVNMLVTVNPQTKQILLTSIPRDYYVELGTIGAMDKLTHAGNFGINESVATVAKLFNVNINYYLRVNFTSVVQIIDALGGVDVYSDTALYDSIQEGMNHMDGQTALAFARERYAYASGDNHRVQNQQAVFEAVLNKCMSSAIISNFSSFLSAIDGTFQTNMSSDEINDLVAMQLSTMSSWTITKQQVTGTGSTSTTTYSMPGSALYVMLPDESSVESCRSVILSLY